jgi:SAM-dependent methyltransferase
MLMTAHENIDFARMWCEDILEPDIAHQEFFDIVVSTFTMHHIDRQHHKLAFDNMLNYCAGGGTLLIIDKVYASFAAWETEKHALESHGELDKLRIMDTECPIFHDQFISYIQCLGYPVHTETISDGLMLFQINKTA